MIFETDILSRNLKEKAWKILLSSLCLMMLAGCVDENLNCNNPDDKEETVGEPYYLGLRIYNATAIDVATRADDYHYDSSGDDYSSSDKNFNIGLASENALYAGYSKLSESPHYLLVFSDDDNKKLEYLLHLGFFDKGETTDADDNSTTSGYTSYKEFYTSSQKTDIPSNITGRTVLVVLNAGTALQTRLEEALRSQVSYNDILEWKIGGETSTNDDYLYFKDSKTNTRYFTMSSSMVFPREDMANTNGNTITSTPGKDNFGPASMVRSFTWFKTKDEAKQAPVFSFFVERLQSKFTMNFKFGSENIYYYFTQDLNDPGSDDHQPIQHCVLEANSTAGNPVIHTSNNSKLLNVDFIPTEEYKTLRYVKDYRRRAPGSEYDDNFIKTSETWKINLTGWGVNATEKEEYIFKNLDITDSYYGEDKWNVPALSPYRNFWAESAHYKDVRFPDQYRPGKKLETTYDANGKISKIEIKDDNSFSPLEGKGNLYNLYYYSYLNLQNRTTHQYAPEHTVDPSSVFTSIPEQDASDIDKTHAIKDLAYMRASTHLILCAQLLIEGMEEEGIYDADSFNDKGQVVKGENSVHSKFYMNGIYWSEDAYLEYVAEYLGYWLQNDFFHNSDGNLYVNVDDLNNKNERVTKLADGGDFYFEKLNMKGSDNWVHIIPNPDVIKEDEPNCNICYYDTKEEKFFKIDRDVFEILALSHPEYFAQRFWNGRMYYSIPVIHYQKDDASLYLGKYGVVRNHWYNYTITKFSGIGTPVDANTQAIVPNNERSYETLGVTLSVLPWHSINEEVDISNQRPNETPDEIDLDLYAKINDWFYTGKYEEF